jgi:hypothetical protein
VFLGVHKENEGLKQMRLHRHQPLTCLPTYIAQTKSDEKITKKPKDPNRSNLKKIEDLKAIGAGLPDFSLYNIPRRGKIYRISTK